MIDLLITGRHQWLWPLCVKESNDDHTDRAAVCLTGSKRLTGSKSLSDSTDRHRCNVGVCLALDVLLPSLWTQEPTATLTLSRTTSICSGVITDLKIPSASHEGGCSGASWQPPG